jgi:CTP synthase (UTP-ammonia lyase)
MPSAIIRIPPEIAILGEFNPDFPPHPATDAAIRHSCEQLRTEVRATWLSTQDIRLESLQDYAGIWVAPGSPYKSFEKTLSAIRYARENRVPCFGTCGGCQHIIIEYARNVLGHRDAQHAEYDPYASNLFISSLTCSLAGREMMLGFVAGSKVAKIYGALEAREKYYCNFGVNPDVVPWLKQGPMKIVGSDHEGEIRVLELPDHPFFIATLFVPQTSSQPDRPHPLVTAFLQAVVGTPDRSRLVAVAKSRAP